MVTFPSTERRLHAREFVLKEAVIVAGKVTIGCSVRNQHEHGAELRVDPQAQIPDRFVLQVPADDATYNAAVRWRRNDRLGVQIFCNAMKG